METVKDTTPRTDAESWTETNQSNSVVSARFARQLEQELIASQLRESRLAHGVRYLLARMLPDDKPLSSEEISELGKLATSPASF